MPGVPSVYKNRVINRLWETNHPRNKKLTEEHVEVLYGKCNEEPCVVEVQENIDKWLRGELDIEKEVALLRTQLWGPPLPPPTPLAHHYEVDEVDDLWKSNKINYPYLTKEHVMALYGKKNGDKQETQKAIDDPLIREFFTMALSGGGRKKKRKATKKKRKASKRKASKRKSSKRKASKRKKASKKKRNTKRRRQR
jgi:hypothetical protein